MQEKPPSKVPGLNLGGGKMPSLQLGAANGNDPTNVSSKPKIGFGLDLSKAKQIQEQHLAKVEHSK